ncbi:hypothetical protein GX441_06150 [bacterium]|nr:hypothetical protein [bacterium]
MFLLYGLISLASSALLFMVFIYKRKTKGSFVMLIFAALMLLLGLLSLFWAYHTATFSLITG